MSYPLIVLSPEKGVELSLIGAKLPPGLSRADFLKIWTRLRQVDHSLNWIVGDCLIYSDHEYGEKYTHALIATDWEYQRLADANYVSVHVPVSLRNEKLSWSHHRVVAPLSRAEQKKYLAQALAEEWSVSELRIAVRQDQATQPRCALQTGFVPASWILEGMRWFRKEDVIKWPAPKRDALREQLKPLVELYEQLA